jgi:hypothetical protein
MVRKMVRGASDEVGFGIFDTEGAYDDDILS